MRSVSRLSAGEPYTLKEVRTVLRGGDETCLLKG